jgi:XTP/dITP diphosphohydrolase
VIGMEHPALVIATRNPGKLREFMAMLAPLGFEVLDLSVAGVSADVDVEETGDTFSDNAILKAVEYGAMTGMLTLADDSGLCVDALDGAPGVQSARYVPGSDEDRVRALLVALADVPDAMRTARFVSVNALHDPSTGETLTFTGEWEGTIAHVARGENGFGYDPIFIVDPASGQTSAELDPAEKDAQSHRGKALAQLVSFLSSKQASVLRG